MAASCHLRFLFGITLLAAFAGSVCAQQHGAETPQQLLKRVAEGIRAGDLEQVRSCILNQRSGKEKAAVTAIAKNLLLQTDVKKFGAAGKAKYGDQFRQILGLRAYLIIVTIGGIDFQALAKDAKIEVDEGADTAVATHGEGLGEMTLNLERQNGRWFLETDLGLKPDGKSTPELHYQAAVHFLRDCRAALENATDQDDFQKQVEKASKTYQAGIKHPN